MNDTWINTQTEPAYIPDDDSIRINVTIINSPPNLANVIESKHSNTIKGSGRGILIAIIVVLIVIAIVFLLLRNSRHKKNEHHK
jgi:hypothetical protein